MTLSRALTLFALTLALAFTPVRSAHAWCQATTVAATPGSNTCAAAGFALSWPQRCVGLSLHVDGSLSLPFEELEPLLDGIATQWSRVACDPPGTRAPSLQLSRVMRTYALVGGTPQGPNANTVYFDAVWAPDPRHSPFTIAVTRRRSLASSGTIYDADVELNERSDENPEGYRFIVDPTVLTSRTPEQLDELGIRDLHTVLLHEAGHVLGLGHSVNPEAIMYFEDESTTRPRRVVTTDDAEGVCNVYPPDGPLAALECNTTPRGGFASGDGGVLTTPGCACNSRTPARPTNALPSGPTAALLGALALLHARRRRASQRAT